MIHILEGDKIFKTEARAVGYNMPLTTRPLHHFHSLRGPIEGTYFDTN